MNKETTTHCDSLVANKEKYLEECHESSQHSLESGRGVELVSPHPDKELDRKIKNVTDIENDDFDDKTLDRKAKISKKYYVGEQSEYGQKTCIAEDEECSIDKKGEFSSSSDDSNSCNQNDKDEEYNVRLTGEAADAYEKKTAILTAKKKSSTATRDGEYGEDISLEDQDDFRENRLRNPSTIISRTIEDECEDNNETLPAPATTLQRRRTSRRPGAHAVAGMRASELNAYDRSSISIRVPVKDPRQKSNDDADSFDEEGGMPTSQELSSGMLSGSDSNVASSTNSPRSIRSRIAPIQMEQVTVLGEVEDDVDANGNEHHNISGSCDETSTTNTNDDGKDLFDNTANTNEGHEEEDVETAIQVKAETHFERGRAWLQSTQGRLCMICSVLLVLAAVAITLYMVLRQNNVVETNENLLDGSGTKKLSQLTVIRDTLMKSGALFNVEAFNDTSSVEHEVVLWLAYEDLEQINATRDPERLVQRYTARFLSMTLLERPGHIESLEKVLADRDENEEDGFHFESDNIENGASMPEHRSTDIQANGRIFWSTNGCSDPSCLDEESKSDLVLHFNVSGHECTWAVRWLNISEFLEIREAEMASIVQDDDFENYYLDDDSTVMGAVSELYPNLTLSCNSEQRVTGFSIEAISLPHKQGLPPEIGNLAHLKDVHLRAISLEQNMTNSSLITNALDRLPNLTTLEIDLLGRGKDMNTLIDGIRNLSHLSALKLSGGSAPISSEITELSRLSELSIESFSDGDEPDSDSLFPSSDFFQTFASRNSLQKLVINSNDVYWTIPNEIRFLRNLTHLMCSSNYQYLTGTLPSIAFGQLTNLEHLDLSSNQLSFFLPPTLTSLKELKYVDVSFNNFAGIIPPGIERLTQLEYLNLDYNNLEGTLPSGMPSLSRLEKVFLSDNRLSGHLQEDVFAGMTNLREFVAPNNMFSGEIPSTIGTSENLTYIDLRNNKLSGGIPPQLFATKVNKTSNKLAHLDLRGNKLVSLPFTLSEATKLNFLYLNDNFLEGTLPTLDKLTKLEDLTLENNQLTGDIPALPSSLMHLNLENNSFTGLPNDDQLLVLSNLSSFYASHNNLLGTVSPSFFRLPSLQWLDLSHNELFGSWTLTIDNIRSIIFNSPVRTVDLSYNQLEGPTPNDIGKYLTEVRELRLQNNNFSSGIPSSLGEMKKLRLLNIGSNYLSGTLPDYVFQNLHNIRELSLDNNDFSGTVPYSVLYLTKLRHLALEGNQRLEGNFDPFCSVYHNISGSWEFVSVPNSIQCWCCIKMAEIPEIEFSGNVSGSDDGGRPEIYYYNVSMDDSYDVPQIGELSNATNSDSDNVSDSMTFAIKPSNSSPPQSILKWSSIQPKAGHMTAALTLVKMEGIAIGCIFLSESF